MFPLSVTLTDTVLEMPGLRDIRKETEDCTVYLTTARYTLGFWTVKAALMYLYVESK
jgi:CO dehydrogenase/acetyl-CoA synthase gamma subunit (corrinoid Fe-S protein)